MRLQCLKTTAKLAPVDTFIYLPKKKMFFFADDKDYDDKNIIFYFEEGIDENGNMIESELVFNENDEVLIVSQYEVNPQELIEEINEQEKNLLEEGEEEEEGDDDKKY